MNKDPILEALARIEAKQDQFQATMQEELAQIRQDCETQSRKTAALVGGLSGGLVSTGIVLIKAKLGL